MENLVLKLIASNLTISSCESLTAGMFSSQLASVPNASKTLLGAIVSYNNLIKEKVVNIDKSIIDEKGVVSSEVAFLMAKNTKEIMHSDICVSFTGNAGPSGMENKPVGLVYSCIYFNDSKFFVYENKYDGNRQQIRQACIDDIVNKLSEILG
ncbi:MAG: CinA family protein [Erysipelotrichaceae bacterium]